MENIHGIDFTVMRKLGEPATLDLHCERCHCHRRCTFIGSAIDKHEAARRLMAWLAVECDLHRKPRYGGQLLQMFA